MKSLSATDIAQMSVDERIQLVEDIWDSVADLPEAIEIPEWHKLKLKKQMDAYHKNPELGSPWADVKKRILG